MVYCTRSTNTEMKEAKKVQGQGELFNGSFYRVRWSTVGLLLGEADAGSNPGWKDERGEKKKSSYKIKWEHKKRAASESAQTREVQQTK